jgi:RNA polymerase sigma-70 factor, ECF subfamily
LNQTADKDDRSDAQRTQWLMRYGPWLRLLARLEIDTRFQGKVSAADAVQQTFVEAWRCWDQFRGTTESERLAWLRRILAHQLARLARHYLGTQKRNAAREQSLQQSLDHSAARLGDMLPGREATPSAIVVAQEEQLQLAGILERLPDEYREVLVLRNLEELPHAEIAQRMGRSEGAVRMLWVRALARLRDELHGHETP